MDPNNLISVARQLAAGQVGRRQGRPRQTDLCRAISNSYYALFHTLARCGADELAGKTRASRSQPAWEQIYRGLEHGHARNQCQNHAVITRFPPEIREFAEHFLLMQRHRHRADYAAVTTWQRLAVLALVDATEDVIRRFNSAPVRDRRAFAIHALFRTRQD